MIKAIRANKPSFKAVEFHKGFNVVLADRLNVQEEHDYKNTRNGSGKTTLIEIIHFCLGANVGKDSVFSNENFKEWVFTLTLDISGNPVELERAADNSGKIYVNGGASLFREESLKYDKSEKRHYFNAKGLNSELLILLFGIEGTEDSSSRYPSFRQLISFCIRRNINGYADPFQAFESPQALPKQICNAYFLGLNLSIVSSFQELKDKEKKIKDYKAAVKSDVFGELSLNIGQLQTEVITHQSRVQNLEKQLSEFQIHPQYNELLNKANEITAEVQRLNNTLVVRQRLLEKYIESIEQETTEISVSEVEAVYNEAGIVFNDALKRSLEETIQFHKTLLSNRKSYLSTEVSRLKREITELRNESSVLDSQRAEKMKFLHSHGALEEYQKMQEFLSVERQALESKAKQLQMAKEVEESQSKLKIEKEELLISARHDLNERIRLIEKAVSLFQENTAFLYPEHGILTIDCDDTGYVFRMDIKSSKSQGVSYMKVFCYDMVLAELGRLNHKHFPDFWVHDSTIFDGVDERQIARSLMLAYNKTQEIGLQYICMLNSDQVPSSEFDDEFNDIFNESVIMKLDDNTDSGGLLGIRF